MSKLLSYLRQGQHVNGVPIVNEDEAKFVMSMLHAHEWDYISATMDYDRVKMTGRIQSATRLCISKHFDEARAVFAQ